METTRRARFILGLVVLLFLGTSFLAVPVAAPPPIPMRTEGQAFDRTGSALPVGAAIHTFVDGVDYSGAPGVVQNAQGSFFVLTEGNYVAPGNTSETTTLQEGANSGDTVIYATGNFTAATDVFREVVAFSSGTVISSDLHFGSLASTPQAIKIQGIVARPALGGNPFVFLCNPTSGPVSLPDYYLELDRPGTYHGPSLSLTGVMEPLVTVRVNLTSAFPLTATGDALKLVYQNPRGAGASGGGLDIVVDRVEFNATRGGTLDWEPGNTIMEDVPAPGVGQILQRDANCADTNRPQDFSLGIEPGLPANGPPSVSISIPSQGQTLAAALKVTFAWTMSDDLFAPADLHVWANVTIGGQTMALLADAVGVTSVAWTTPDVAVDGAVFHVDVVDPFGERASDSRIFNLSRQSPVALLIAILIAVVLVAFLIFGFLRARKEEQRPPPAPPPAPPFPPLVGPPPAMAAESAPAEAKKVCPRCHTAVNATDVTCFYCGHRFTPP